MMQKLSAKSNTRDHVRLCQVVDGSVIEYPSQDLRWPRAMDMVVDVLIGVVMETCNMFMCAEIGGE